MFSNGWVEEVRGLTDTLTHAQLFMMVGRRIKASWLLAAHRQESLIDLRAAGRLMCCRGRERGCVGEERGSG